MQISIIKTESGQPRAFEVSVVAISIRSIVSILQTVEGVSEVKARRLFSGTSPDVHVRFLCYGQPFMVLEPYGDSSKYWIGPESDITVPHNTDNLVKAFEQYQPSFLSRLIGGK